MRSIKKAAAAIALAALACAATSLRAADLPSAASFDTEPPQAATRMPAFAVEEKQSPKTHTLFMGADIEVNLDRDCYKVENVIGSNWVIDVHGRQTEISTKRAPVNLKITPKLKLTEKAATIDGFKKVAAYSFENDPSVLLTKGLNRDASMNADLLAVAANARNRVDAMTNKEFAPFAGSDDQFSANAMMNVAQHAYSDTHADGGPATRTGSPAPSTVLGYSGDAGGLGGASNNPALNAVAVVAASAGHMTENGTRPERIATQGLDALDIEFDIRSARPLREPYVVTMTKFTTPETKAGMVQSLVYAVAIHPIDEHLSHVKFEETGFPFNYELKEFQMHIYDRGEEIATNIADDRVELTREEAFEYVKMEYLGAHLKETLPATPAMGRFPADLRERLSEGKYLKDFYVKVNASGLGSEAYSDPACTDRIKDDYIDGIVAKMRFKPALKNGKATAGVAAVNLNRLSI